MANIQIKICCILLSVMMLLSVLSISAGNAFARYENKVSFRTILEPAEENMSTGGFFTKASEAEVTVLCGELSQVESQKSFSIPIESSGESDKEKLFWSLSTEDAQYLNVKMSIGTEELESGEEVVIPKNTEKTITMTVSTTNAAWINAHEALEIDIDVKWGELSGTFRINLPEVKAVSGENPEISDDSENTETLSENAGETSAQAENPESSEEEDAENGIMSLQVFDPKQLLPVKVMLKSDVSSVVFGLFEEGYSVARDFPEGTHFSLDNGESFYMLYSEDTVKIDAEDISGAVLFDFGNTELAEKESISILMEPWANGVGKATSKITVLTNAAESFGTIENESQGSILVSGNEQEGSEAAMSKGWNAFVLNKENSVEIVFPAEWTEADLTYSVQILEVAENGSLVYNNSARISSEYKKNENEHGLVLKIGDNVPKAGTYRVYMIWEYKGIRFYKNDITFFINYSTPSSGTLKS